VAEYRNLTIDIGVSGQVIRVDTVGLVTPGTPGLFITPAYARRNGPAPVAGRFTLTHGSGYALVPLAWCSHDVQAWAGAAGWIGIDWRADRETVTASPVGAVFAWRLADEFRPHCDACPEVPGDRHRVDYAAWWSDRIRN
jgi:hypothetical protein